MHFSYGDSLREAPRGGRSTVYFGTPDRVVAPCGSLFAKASSVSAADIPICGDGEISVWLVLLRWADNEQLRVRTNGNRCQCVS